MPDLLTTADIMQRYGCERHTAAAIMRKLPVFKVGKRLFIKARDLMAWEESKTEYPMIKVRNTAQAVARIPRR